jgi:hypothetical protein
MTAPRSPNTILRFLFCDNPVVFASELAATRRASLLRPIAARKHRNSPFGQHSAEDSLHLLLVLRGVVPVDGAF